MPAMDDAYALVVGIADYRHVTRLPAAVRHDALAVRDLLADPWHCGYPPGHVALLLDEQATRDGLLTALSSLAARTSAGSSLFIYISGHGAQLTSGPQAGEYLLPVDTVLRSGQTLASTAISGREFTALLAAIPASKVLVVFDCCHAGGLAQPKGAAAPLVKAGLPGQYYERLAAGRGRAILSSSRDSESSYVLPGAVHSLFTQHLLAGLGGGVPSADGLIRIFDLFEYVQPRVTCEQPGQHPVFQAGLEENFPVALHSDGKKDSHPSAESGFRYDAYLSYADQAPDSTWVWETLLPRLDREGVRVAVSGASRDPGVPVVVGIERGILQAKRTVIILSEAYLEDNMANFENVVAQSLGIEEGAYRLLPVKIATVDETRLPLRLRMLAMLDLTDPRRADREFARLAAALRGPLPRHS
jgi:caspase domain-containing protein/TIR domain-containing protein